MGQEIDAQTLLQLASIITAGLTMAIGSVGPALGEARAVVAALEGMARQPEAQGSLFRTMLVGMALVETTAIYCLFIAMILLFYNPFLRGA